MFKHVSNFHRFQLFSPNQELNRGLEKKDVAGVTWRSIRNVETVRAKLLVSISFFFGKNYGNILANRRRSTRMKSLSYNVKLEILFVYSVLRIVSQERR